MAKYNKFWTALVAAVLIGLDQFFGISLGFEAEGIVTTGLAILGALGVRQVPNQ